MTMFNLLKYDIVFFHHNLKSIMEKITFAKVENVNYFFETIDKYFGYSECLTLFSDNEYTYIKDGHKHNHIWDIYESYRYKDKYHDVTKFYQGLDTACRIMLIDWYNKIMKLE